MPVSLFELIMGWVFLGAIICGVIMLFVAFRQKSRRDQMTYFVVAFGLPVGAYALLMLGSWMEI